MTCVTCCAMCGGDGFKQPHMGAFTTDLYFNTDNQASPCRIYQKFFNTWREREVIIYVHDDVAIHDPSWLDKVMTLFETNDKCVAVGLGGATSLGRPDLYRKPYNIWNMARGGYASNQEDAETHGERYTGVRRVAVLDAFFMAVRREFLASVGGWPVNHITHHGLDLWLACEAARADKEIWMTGVKVLHYGGGTSTKETYAKASWKQGGTLEAEHEEPHRWLYENYRDVLPIVIE